MAGLSPGLVGYWRGGVPGRDGQPRVGQDLVWPGLVGAEPDPDDAAAVELVDRPLHLPALEGRAGLRDLSQRGIDVAADRIVVVPLLPPELQPLVELAHGVAGVYHRL